MTTNGETTKPFLAKGNHRTPEEGTCLMELVALWAGEPHTDSPKCCSPVLAAAGRYCNDLLADRHRQELLELANSLIGTNCTRCERRRAQVMVLRNLRLHTPRALRNLRLRDQARALELQPRRTQLLREIPSRRQQPRKDDQDASAVHLALRAADTLWLQHQPVEAAQHATQSASKARSRSGPREQAHALRAMMQEAILACPHREDQE